MRVSNAGLWDNLASLHSYQHSKDECEAFHTLDKKSQEELVSEDAQIHTHVLVRKEVLLDVGPRSSNYLTILIEPVEFVV